MRFAAIAMAVGVAGLFLASNLQGAPISGAVHPSTLLTDDIVTGSIPARTDQTSPDAVRLIDLRTGATCKLAKPDPAERTFQLIPFGPDCSRSPGMSRVAYWRSTNEGALIMADSGGGTVLEFAPGDGVLYESIFPDNELITIVPAKS
jgi:hypothetical protein